MLSVRLQPVWAACCQDGTSLQGRAQRWSPGGCAWSCGPCCTLPQDCTALQLHTSHQPSEPVSTLLLHCTLKVGVNLEHATVLLASSEHGEG